jgi:hypothetical protein
VSDIDIAMADSLKVLDLNGRLEKQTFGERANNDAIDPSETLAAYDFCSAKELFAVR